MIFFLQDLPSSCQSQSLLVQCTLQSNHTWLREQETCHKEQTNSQPSSNPCTLPLDTFPLDLQGMEQWLHDLLHKMPYTSLYF